MNPGTMLMGTFFIGDVGLSCELSPIPTVVAGRAWLGDSINKASVGAAMPAVVAGRFDAMMVVQL